MIVSVASLFVELVHELNLGLRSLSGRPTSAQSLHNAALTHAPAIRQHVSSDSEGSPCLTFPLLRQRQRSSDPDASDGSHPQRWYRSWEHGLHFLYASELYRRMYMVFAIRSGIRQAHHGQYTRF